MQELITKALKDACALTLTHGAELMSLVSGNVSYSDENKRHLAEECMSLQAYFSVNKEPIADTDETRCKLCEFRRVLDELKEIYS